MKEEEIWLDVIGYEDFYRVSSLGRMFSKRQNKIMKLNPDSRGYLQIKLFSNTNKIRMTYRVHRIVAMAFLSNPENKPEVNHKNKIVSDNRVSNLEWSTVAENLEHKLSFKLNLKKMQDEFSIKIKREICSLVPL